MKMILLLLFVGAGPIGAADWPNWRGPRFDGISAETKWDPQEIGEVAWEAGVGTGFASVAVVGGRLYTLGHDGKKKGGTETVHCLDATTGKEIWTDSYPAELLPKLHEGGPAATPTVHAETVFTLGKDGRFNAYAAAGGEKLWSRDLLADSAMEKPPEWGFAGSPLVVGELVVVEAAHTIAYHLKTGEVAWKSVRFQPAYATPAKFSHGKRKMLVTLKSEGLVILDAETGKTVAQQEWKTRFSTNATTPIVLQGKSDRTHSIFISTGYNRGCGMYRFDGTELVEEYASKSISNHMANCVRLGGHFYGITGNTHGIGKKELVCMESATGEVKWRQGGFGCGSIAAAGDRLIILSERGELVVAQAAPEAFTEISRAQVNGGRCWTVPVLSGGRIFTRNSKGHLVAVKVGEGE